jgi:hypothetical protein
MNLRNDLNAEVLLAHFKNYFQNYNDTTHLFDSGDTSKELGHGYPKGYFKLFNLPPLKEGIDIEEVNRAIIKVIMDNYGQLPKLEGIPEPLVEYNQLLGININFKRIVVTHPDGRISTVNFRYKFYRIRYLLKFLVTKDVWKKAIIYNSFLKSRTTETVQGQPLQLRTKTTAESVIEQVANNNWASEVENDEVLYTIRRQRLALQLIFEAIGWDITQINLAAIARIIYILTAKEIPKGKVKLYNSNIYKALKNPNNVSEKRHKEDLLFLKEAFADLNLENDPAIEKIITGIEEELEDLKSS